MNTDPGAIFTTLHFLCNLWMDTKRWCYITLGWKVLPGTNAPAYFPQFCRLWRKWSVVNTVPSSSNETRISLAKFFKNKNALPVVEVPWIFACVKHLSSLRIHENVENIKFWFIDIQYLDGAHTKYRFTPTRNLCHKTFLAVIISVTNTLAYFQSR